MAECVKSHNPESYLSIGHDSEDYIVWLYDGSRIHCERCRDHMDVDTQNAIFTGRVDLETNKGSIAFDSDSDITEDFVNELIENFPGIKFYVFGGLPGQYGVSLSKYLEKNKIGV